VESHISALKITHAVTLVRPFHGGGLNELVKQPKVYAFDTGFVSYARGWDPLRQEDIAADKCPRIVRLGPLPRTAHRVRQAATGGGGIAGDANGRGGVASSMRPIQAALRRLRQLPKSWRRPWRGRACQAVLVPA